MKTIWKYELDPYNLKLQVPIGSKILSVGTQNEKICLWLEVDPENTIHMAERVFEVYGTGHYINEDLLQEYIGTVMLEGGALVFHIYEVFV